VLFAPSTRWRPQKREDGGEKPSPLRGEGVLGVTELYAYHS